MPISRFSLFLATALALPGLAHGQEAPAPVPVPVKDSAFRLSGTIRLRVETIDGQARTGFNSADTLVDVRTTLAATWDTGPIRLAAELRDGRAYGSNAGTPLTTSDVNTVELQQLNATARLGSLLGTGTSLSIQAGRFLLNLGSRRLFAISDYRNTTNGFTGVRADVISAGGTSATILYALPQLRLPDDPAALRRDAVGVDRESFDLVVWGGLVSRARVIGSAAAELSYYHLGERDAPGRPTRDRSLDTFGARVFRKPEPARLDFEIEGDYQTGHISQSALAGAPVAGIAAWFVHAHTGYSFAGRGNIRLALSLDAASGDAPGGRFGRFDTLFGTRRADFAPSGLYSAITRTNVVTPAIRIEATPSRAFDMMASYRPMWLADRHDAFASTGVIDRTGRSGVFAGHQVDARARLWLVPKRLRVELDGTLLIKGGFLRDAPNAPTGRTTRYFSSNLIASF
jgi:hypothetical protein